MHDPDMSWRLRVNGQNACPSEDVGGAPGYADFFDAISDPTHEGYGHFLKWCGGRFDPGAFDPVLANQKLSQVKFWSSRRPRFDAYQSPCAQCEAVARLEENFVAHKSGPLINDRTTVDPVMAQYPNQVYAY